MTMKSVGRITDIEHYQANQLKSLFDFDPIDLSASGETENVAIHPLTLIIRGQVLVPTPHTNC